jgi:hypothetical protein
MSANHPSYLYGFLRAPDEALPDLIGVFGAPVLAQVDGDLAAVVSPVPPGPHRAARDDVLAHSEVLQALIEDHDVVPAAFGTVYPQGFDIAALPRSERRAVSRLLDDLGGKVEVQVRATYDELGVTAAIVDSDSRLRRLRSTRNQDYPTQLAIGTRFAEVLDRRRRADSDAVAKTLSRVADRVLTEPPSGDWGAFRLSLLVQRRTLPDVESALQGLADGQASYLTMDWIGPLPPYSFVQSSTAKRAG